MYNADGESIPQTLGVQLHLTPCFNQVQLSAYYDENNMFNIMIPFMIKIKALDFSLSKLCSFNITPWDSNYVKLISWQFHILL